MEEKKILVAKYGSDKTPLCLGNLEIPCYVLDNGMRVFSGRGIQKAIGYDSKSGQWMNSFCKMDGVSSYLCAGDNSISERLSKPIKFKRNNAGGSQSTANGYEVTLLVDICSAIIDANRAGVFDNNVIVRNADIIIRSVAKVGIIALVDEATGYQYERENDELQRILKAYISEELIGFPYRGYKLATNENLDGFIERGVCVLGQPDASGVGPNDHGMLICGVTPSGGIFQVMFSVRNKIYHRYRSTSGVWNPWYVYTSSVYNP